MTKFREVMKSKRCTFIRLSELTGINVKTLQSYGTGHRPIDLAPIKSLVKISIALTCPITDLLEDQETVELLKSAKLRK